MNRFTALITLAIFLAASCGTPVEKQDNSGENNTRDQQPVIGLSPGSYQYCFVTADDTAILSVRVTDQGVDGSLLSQYFGKERSDGKFENAHFRKDTLFADYRYWSDAGPGLREVIFLINDDTAREGYGPTTDADGKTVFTSHKEVLFNGPLMSADGCGTRVPTFKKPEKKG